MQDASDTVIDGQSFKALLLDASATESGTDWRTQFLVEHNGEFRDVIDGCPALKNQNVAVSLFSVVCIDSYLCSAE